jgi:RimJ/RimL family protein N-acetyltransferase
MVKLVSAELGHCIDIIGWRNDKMETLRTPYFTSVEMQEEFYKEVVSNRNSKHRYFAITNKIYIDIIFIAFGGITNIEYENSIAEISLIVNPEYVNKGYGTESAECLLKYAFGNMNLGNIYGECYKCNETGVKFWEKLTDKYNGYKTMLPSRKFYNCEYWDSLYFNINRNDFYLNYEEKK